MRIFPLITVIAIAAIAVPATSAGQKLIAHPQVKLETTEGVIVIELDTKRAPLSVAHFVKLTRNGFYDGTIFHRVARDFVVQGGGYSTKFVEKEDSETLANESGNGLTNRRGTIAMARTDDPHSANSQFFINVSDNTQLDPRSDRWGYAVFGKVIEGMDVVDGIASLPTGPGGSLPKEVPLLQVVIKKATVITD